MKVKETVTYFFHLSFASGLLQHDDVYLCSGDLLVKMSQRTFCCTPDTDIEQKTHCLDLKK